MTAYFKWLLGNPDSPSLLLLINTSVLDSLPCSGGPHFLLPSSFLPEMWHVAHVSAGIS